MACCYSNTPPIVAGAPRKRKVSALLAGRRFPLVFEFMFAFTLACTCNEGKFSFPDLCDALVAIKRSLSEKSLPCIQVYFVVSLNRRQKRIDGQRRLAASFKACCFSGSSRLSGGYLTPYDRPSITLLTKASLSLDAVRNAKRDAPLLRGTVFC